MNCIYTTSVKLCTNSETSSKTQTKVTKTPTQNNIVINESGEVSERDIREDVWNQLSSGLKEQIKGTWKEVYVVDFTTKNLYIPSNKLFFASIDHHKIIGVGFVE